MHIQFTSRELLSLLVSNPIIARSHASHHRCGEPLAPSPPPTGPAEVGHPAPHHRSLTRRRRPVARKPRRAQPAAPALQPPHPEGRGGPPAGARGDGPHGRSPPAAAVESMQCPAPEDEAGGGLLVAALPDQHCRSGAALQETVDSATARGAEARIRAENRGLQGLPCRHRRPAGNAPDSHHPPPPPAERPNRRPHRAQHPAGDGPAEKHSG